MENNNSVNKNLINTLLGGGITDENISEEMSKDNNDMTTEEDDEIEEETIDLHTCKLVYNGAFDNLDPDEYKAAVKAYKSMVEARFNLITTEKWENRMVIAEAIIHDVTMNMKNIGYDIDYNNIREDDMDKETIALIAINDIITLYKYAIFTNKYTANEDIPNIISNMLEEDNIQYAAGLDVHDEFGDVPVIDPKKLSNIPDDHDVSGLID
jgi:hypothetical protein